MVVLPRNWKYPGVTFRKKQYKHHSEYNKYEKFVMCGKSVAGVHYEWCVALIYTTSKKLKHDSQSFRVTILVFFFKLMSSAIC